MPRTPLQSASAPVGRATFRNPILDQGQDPSIVYHGSWYYLVQSDRGDGGLHIRRARTLADLSTAEEISIWKGHGDRCCEVWAPELIRLGAHWYVYFAADDGKNENHRMYVLRSRGEDPMGPFDDCGKIASTTDRWAIDGTVVQWPDGSLYFVWSGWEGHENIQQNLYIARMNDPCTIVGDRVLICEPELPWERHGGPPYINEGPAAVVRGERVFLTYSGSGSWTDSYCLGLLSTDASKDPMRRDSWNKSPDPVFTGVSTAYGSGHNSFFRSPDDSELWMTYHANVRAGTGWDGRSIRAQPVAFSADGYPLFGEPVPAYMPVPVPAGEPADAAESTARL